MVFNTIKDKDKELSKIKELEFIRYTTSHPLDMDLELIEAHRDVSKLMPYLHLPDKAPQKCVDHNTTP